MIQEIMNHYKTNVKSMKSIKNKMPKGRSDYLGILRIPVPGPGTDYKSKKDYDRKKSRSETRKIIRENSE